MALTIKPLPSPRRAPTNQTPPPLLSTSTNFLGLHPTGQRRPWPERQLFTSLVISIQAGGFPWPSHIASGACPATPEYGVPAAAVFSYGDRLAREGVVPRRLDLGSALGKAQFHSGEVDGGRRRVATHHPVAARVVEEGGLLAVRLGGAGEFARVVPAQCLCVAADRAPGRVARVVVREGGLPVTGGRFVDDLGERVRSRRSLSVGVGAGGVLRGGQTCVVNDFLGPVAYRVDAVRLPVRGRSPERLLPGGCGAGRRCLALQLAADRSRPLGRRAGGRRGPRPG